MKPPSLKRREVLTALPALAISSQSAAPSSTSHSTESSCSTDVSILRFIPSELHAGIRSETCETDLAPFINRGIRYVLSLPGGGSLLFPQGAYDVSEIDATNDDPAQFYKLLKLKGAGPFATKIRSATSGRILLNAMGRNNMHVEDMQFLSLRFQSQAAIYLCRNEKSPNCNNNKFTNLTISGNYSISSIISIGAESTSWSRCRFENSNRTNNHICFFTSHDCDSIELLNHLPYKKTSGPNTDNSMVDCEFYAPFDNATPLIFSGSAAFGLQLCSIICGDSSRTKLVTYRPSGDIFTGPVTWINPHFEVIGSDNCIHFLDTAPGVCYFRGINSYSGNCVVGSRTAFLDFPENKPQSQPVLQTSTWTVPIVPQGLEDLTFRVFAISDSSIDFKMGENVGTLNVSGFVKNSRYQAANAYIAQVIASERTSPR